MSFLDSSQDIDTLASHLSEYAKIQIPVRNNDNNNGDNGEQKMQWAFFAFYDPRVFPQFVESNNHEQNGEFFQYTNAYHCENIQNTDQLNSYHYHNGTLQQSSINLMQTSEPLPEQTSPSITVINTKDHPHG